jgi:nitrogen fixation protein FixH
MLMLFFGIVGGVNTVMLRLALATMPGLDARNGYDESQRYNQRIADAEAMGQRGLQVNARLAPAKRGAELAVDIASRNGSALVGATVSARLEHPALRSRDLSLDLVETAPGRYAASLAELPAGQWTVMIIVREAAGSAPIFLSRNRVTFAGA